MKLVLHNPVFGQLMLGCLLLTAAIFSNQMGELAPASVLRVVQEGNPYAKRMMAHAIAFFIFIFSFNTFASEGVGVALLVSALIYTLYTVACKQEYWGVIITAFFLVTGFLLHLVREDADRRVKELEADLAKGVADTEADHAAAVSLREGLTIGTGVCCVLAFLFVLVGMPAYAVRQHKAHYKRGDMKGPIGWVVSQIVWFGKFLFLGRKSVPFSTRELRALAQSLKPFLGQAMPVT